jgi:hypothetical protein
VPDDIEKRREARTTPATGIKGAVHSKPVGEFQKTGYADLRVARRRSRLDFGLTRAQPNLRRHHGIDLPDPLRRRRYRWTASATKIPCIRPNIYVRSVQLLTPQIGARRLTALNSSRGRERFATQNSICVGRGNRSFAKAPFEILTEPLL